MKNLFQRLFGSKHPTEQKPKKFTFDMHEAQCVGDYYKYTVEAASEDEAFKKLVNYFYGNNGSVGIETQSGTVSYPHLSKFIHSNNMPYWFAKRISGVLKQGGRDYQAELEEYCKKNEIEIQQ